MPNHVKGLPTHEKKELIAQYLATPGEFRPKSLAELLRALGITISSHHYNLAKDPQVIAKALQLIGVSTIAELPNVMNALVEGAKAGNVRAADVLLRHVRELALLGSREPEGEKPLHRLLEDTNKMAASLNKLADSLSTKAAANPKQDKAIEAEVKDVPQVHKPDTHPTTHPPKKPPDDPLTPLLKATQAALLLTPPLPPKAPKPAPPSTPPHQ